VIDRATLYARWHSVALATGTRAAGATQNLQPDTITGTHAMKSTPNVGDLLERRELSGGMDRWLIQMNGQGTGVCERMHEAITRATENELQRLLGSIERAEWLLKLKWTGNGHRHMEQKEADQYGREDNERTIIMGYRGIHTKDVAEELQTTDGSIRWLRRKHGLSIKGERIYPCTVAVLNSCAACQQLNEYGDDYEGQEAA
jgi:hypothetical protein